MAESVPKVAFVDVDGTLVSGNAWAGVLRYAHVPRLKVLLLFAYTLPRIVLHRLHLLGEVRFQAGWIRGLAWLLKGWSAADVEAFFSWLAQDFLHARYQIDMQTEMQQLAQQGTQIVLISLTFEGAVEHIAQHVGAQGAIGSRLQIVDGVCTGRLRGRACVGPRKLDFIRAYLSDHMPEVSPLECIAYADSYSDAVMLAAMGDAVAVAPDRQLRAAALEQNWRVQER
ncbi:MAG: HAD family hydrolase [Anaerolineales bacterium]